MKRYFLLAFAAFSFIADSQELYPFTEPASNMPAHSVAVKNTSVFQRDIRSGKIVQRQMPEWMLALNKNWMMHLSSGFSDMQRPKFSWESIRLYAKYRFLSNDDVHKHFRMAAFGAAAYSRNHLGYNEINIGMGEQSGVQAGLIATQLWNKTAFSATAGWNEVLNNERWSKAYIDRYAGRSFTYSLSAGYLLLPFEYKNYNQTNVNLYAELLGGRNIAFPREKQYVDLAPSVQAIFGSTAKLNVGYRFQLSSDIYRLTKNSWVASFEYIFLNALKKKS